MKKLLIAFLSLIMFVGINNTFAQSQRETRNIKAFSKLELGGVFEVQIRQGDKEKLELEANPRLLEYVIVKNEGNRLIVKMREKSHFKKMKKIKIYVTITDIDELEISTVGNVESVGTLNLDKLYLRNHGVGNLDLKLNAKQLNAKISAVGNIRLAGNIDVVEIDNKSVGNLEAFDLKANKLTIDNRGVGSAEVYASKEISINSSGVGSLYYKGDATVKSLNSRGIGKIKKL